LRAIRRPRRSDRVCRLRHISRGLPYTRKLP
jgi:hypothetical protein